MTLRRLHPYIQPQSFVAKAPGRINLIGEHTDYNEGFVLPAAIDKAIYTAITPRKDNEININALDLQETYNITTDKIAISKKRWPNYVLGVIARFAATGIRIPGFDLTFTGDVPLGGGLSSSAAVECSVATAMNEMLQTNIDKLELARMCQLAEHTYAGVKCGIMDQFASLFGKKDHVIKLDCQSMEYEYIPFRLKGHKILLFDTNIKHSLANSEYNIRHQQCVNAVLEIAKEYPNVKSLRDATVDMVNQVLKTKNKILWQRSMYVVEENQRLLDACIDLQKNDFAAFGGKMYLTHEGLSQMYDVSCTELDFLVQESRAFPEVIGARMMGGGFGGCTINIIKEDAAAEISAYIKKKYEKVMNRVLDIHDVKIDNGGTLIRHFENMPTAEVSSEAQ